MRTEHHFASRYPLHLHRNGLYCRFVGSLCRLRKQHLHKLRQALRHNRQYGDPSAPACRWCCKKNGEQALGRSRGGFGTKIHACVEGFGQLARFVLTGGHVHDSTQAEILLKEIEPQAVLADKAYDTNALLECIAMKKAKAVIPPKENRKEQREFDRYHYRSRNLVERFFAHIKQFRRVATRYDKLAERFASFVAIAASMLWIK